MAKILLPHWTELPENLKSAINIAQYSAELCPYRAEIFTAFYKFPVRDTKVIILGSDPYSDSKKANGLAYGYKYQYLKENKPKKSLKRLVETVEQDTGEFCQDYTLNNWANQGVLLLNLRLTNRTSAVSGHKDLGWETIITEYLKELDTQVKHKVYLLWGREAGTYRKHLDLKNNLILTGCGPNSPKFKTKEYFSTANDYLERRERGKIIW